MAWLPHKRRHSRGGDHAVDERRRLWSHQPVTGHADVDDRYRLPEQVLEKVEPNMTMRLNRRAFIGTMGAALLAGRHGEAASISRLGAQLYTVRAELAKDFEGTLAKVAAAGYDEVEFAGYFNKTPAEVRDVLQAELSRSEPPRVERAPHLAQKESRRRRLA